MEFFANPTDTTTFQVITKNPSAMQRANYRGTTSIYGIANKLCRLESCNGLTRTSLLLRHGRRRCLLKVHGRTP